jgi:hypothetical protein
VNNYPTGEPRPKLTFNDLVGKTIESVEDHATWEVLTAMEQDGFAKYDVPTAILRFTDGTAVRLEGGGYDGYGDYLTVEPVSDGQND